MRLPYGTWTSSITPESLATGQGSLDEVRVEGRDTYWLAGRPSEAGRTALMAHDGTQAREVLPAPWDVRTRVHEYGGGAYAVRGGTIVFSHAGDDRLYRLDPGAGEPVAVTPPGPWRFGGRGRARAARLRGARGPLPRPGTGQRAGAARPRRRQHRRWRGARHRHRLRLAPRGLPRRPVDRLGRLGPPEHAVGLHDAAAGRAHRRRAPARRSSSPGVPTSRPSSRRSVPTARCGSSPTSRGSGPCTATPARARWRCTTTAPTTPRRSGSWARSTSPCSMPTAPWCGGGTPPWPGSACSTPAPGWSSRSTSRG